MTDETAPEPSVQVTMFEGEFLPRSVGEVGVLIYGLSQMFVIAALVQVLEEVRTDEGAERWDAKDGINGEWLSLVIQRIETQDAEDFRIAEMSMQSPLWVKLVFTRLLGAPASFLDAFVSLWEHIQDARERTATAGAGVAKAKVEQAIWDRISERIEREGVSAEDLEFIGFRQRAEMVARTVAAIDTLEVDEPAA